jgi:protein-S-isoprenylcysteine O-methyltransferase Ste14
LRWITLLSGLFWLIAYWRGGRKGIHDIFQSMRARTNRLDTALMLVILLCSLVAGVAGLLFSLGLDPAAVFHSLVVSSLGCLCVILGIAGMFYCRRALGRFWTAETTLLAEHQVVTGGPYRLVRHPIYSCAILMYLGWGLVFPAWWNLLAVGMAIGAYALKAWDEDRFLEQGLPGYREYR